MSTVKKVSQYGAGNGAKFTMNIRKFDRKIKSFRGKEEILSRIFKIGKARFQIELFPQGNPHYSEDENHVSVFLTNMSCCRLKANCTFAVKDITKTLVGKHYETGNSYRVDAGPSWGVVCFVPHHRCVNGDVLCDDGTFKLEVTVEILEEEVASLQRNITDKDHEKQAMEREIEELKEYIKVNNERQKRNIWSLKAVLETERQVHAVEMEELRSAIQRLKVTESPGGGSSLAVPLDCPICWELVQPPMRLMQCGQGHILCDGCYHRLQAEAKAQLEAMEFEQDMRTPHLGPCCPTCREDITGRPSQLETVLGLNY
jgi:hypothetical protein